jgi:hypothetical protein
MTIGRMFGLAPIVLVLAGCVAAPPLAITPGSESVRVGSNDANPGDEEIGPVTATHGNGCGGFGFRGSYEGAVVELKNKALAMRADYVQILTLREPHSEPYCYVNEYVINGSAYRRGPKGAAPQAAAAATGSRQTLQGRLIELQSLRDQKLITTEEYDRMRRDALAVPQ